MNLNFLFINTVSLIQEKLKSLNIKLPPAQKVVGFYLPVLIVDNLIYTSGTLPFDEDGKLYFTQQIDFNNIEEGQLAAVCAVKNALAQLEDHLGSLDRIERIIRLAGYINSQTGFSQQSLIMNAASELLINIWGEKGQHVRTAIGVNELPLDSSIEIELIAKLKS